MSRKLIVILNPVAGKGAAAEKADAIRRWLKQQNADHQLLLTEGHRHAVDLAYECSGRPKTAVIAAGGDGTANEVINGLMDRWEQDGGPYPEFGIIPIGRGNDLAFGAGVPGHWEEALNRLSRPGTVPLDVGRLRGGDFPEGLWFGNGVGVGFDAIVGFEANQMKRIHGEAAYTIGALKTIIRYPKAPKVEMIIDSRKTIIEPAIISVMNGRRMGGAFYMAPEASMHDGRLNWCRTDQGSRWNLLSTMTAYMKGTQTRRSNTVAGTASGITIKALEGSLAVHADGETVCRSGDFLDISVAPGALRLLGSLND